MDSKQNSDDQANVEMLDFSEKEKDHSQKGKDKGENKFIKTLKEKFDSLLSKFKDLPPARQTYVIVGAVLLFSVMIGFFGYLIIVLLAAGILFVGISGKPFFTDFLKKRSWNKNKKAKRKEGGIKKDKELKETVEK